jgi:hypothetical protein
MFLTRSTEKYIDETVEEFFHDRELAGTFAS